MTGDIVPKTCGWQVALIPPELGSSTILHIRGEVELGNTNEVPRLVLSEPPSLDPAVSDLSLEVEVAGPSQLAMRWAALEFRHSIPGMPPETVRILWMGVEVAVLTPAH